MLRALGAGLVCLAIGCMAALRLSQREAALRSMHTALVQMETYCKCLRMDPDEIIAAVMVFLPAENREELMRKMEVLPYTKEEKHLVRSVADALYDASQEAQTRQTAFAASRFEELLHTARQKREGNAKLYASLGFLCGLCVFLMCI